MKKVLLLGVGNILMTDEGVGIHIIKEIEKRADKQVEYDILDGGTGGCNLIYELIEYDIVIIVDAIIDNNKPGTLSVREPKYSEDFPDMLSAHDFGLKAMIDSLIFMGKLPKIYILTISVSNINEMNITLSDGLKKSFARNVKLVEYFTALIIRYKSENVNYKYRNKRYFNSLIFNYLIFSKFPSSDKKLFTSYF